MKLIRRRKGFTLIEVLMALLVVIPVILGTIGVNIYTYRTSETSRNTMTAVQDANTVVERIRNVASGQGLNQVVATYPSGQAVSGFANLTNEQVVVTYPSSTADPLAITITVTWQDPQGRAMSRALVTQVTRR